MCGPRTESDIENRELIVFDLIFHRGPYLKPGLRFIRTFLYQRLESGTVTRLLRLCYHQERPRNWMESSFPLNCKPQAGLASADLIKARFTTG